MIKTLLQWELERRGLLRDQYNTVPGISTTHAVVHLVHRGRDAVAEGKQVALISIDVGGAFNQIEHSVLVKRLLDLNLPDIAHWIRLWLLLHPDRNLSQQIHLDDVSLILLQSPLQSISPRMKLLKIHRLTILTSQPSRTTATTPSSSGIHHLTLLDRHDSLANFTSKGGREGLADR